MLFDRYTRRQYVSESSLENTADEVFYHLNEVLDKHGRGAMLSTHEIYGILDEEVNEFKDAVHNNDLENIKKELLDVAQTAIFGLASIEEYESIERNESIDE